MMKKSFLILMVSLFTTAAMAQVNVIPADTRLYLQVLENGNKPARVRGEKGAEKQKEAKLFISCTPDADTKAIEAQIKALGAKPQGQKDNETGSGVGFTPTLRASCLFALPPDIDESRFSMRFALMKMNPIPFLIWKAPDNTADSRRPPFSTKGLRSR